MRDANSRQSQEMPRTTVHEHIVEIVSDSGEGAQKAGQALGAISAKMGNGVWTVEIIPAEIKPPARSREGASGIRVRIGDHPITNMGDEADLVVAFNEQVLYGRLQNRAYRPGTVLLLDNRWAADPDENIRAMYAEALEEFRSHGLEIIELPLDEECRKHTPNPRLGKNMFVLGMLCQIYNRDLERARQEIATVFRRKGDKVIALNHKLLQAGYDYAATAVPLRFDIPCWDADSPKVVMNGNQATALGIMAAGIEVVAMYPITPATSVSHQLGDSFPATGGFLHQAEDEIAAIGFAIGASYAGRTAATVTSGPGMALKTEFIGLAVMAEVPLVVIDVQRGGPSTGLPTKVEQGDLLGTLFGAMGDTPKIVIAPATIEECFHFPILARRLAEDFRGPVFILSDANLATGVTAFPRPTPQAEWMAPPPDQSPWEEGLAPYAWDEATGVSPRPIPGQKGGEYTLTGLAHNERSKVAYAPEPNEHGLRMRSRKLAALQRTLKPPVVNGDPEGDLLVVGWGSTLGAIEEAVGKARSEGLRVSSLHLRFLSPMEPGLKEIFSRFKQVITVELNYSDPADDPFVPASARRYGQLAFLLRAQTLVDVDCFTLNQGLPVAPGKVYAEITRRLPTHAHAAR
ncbi:MAG: 2-oxoacid:acceptor oxidoreductase subunit alpha [Deltaproteobacteria bacterium]|nr:MAG: 2-oxoacid:acceptor oxidoreductase subunit alpha [Deltaproteobacteria bacterium]